MSLSTSSLMARLPPELIQIICSFLPTAHLCAFRLTCKEAAASGASHLVDSIHVMFNAKSFRNLLKISQHPVLSKHVHKLFYEARFLEDLTREEWELNILDNERGVVSADFDTRVPEPEAYDEETQKRFDEGWKHYKPMLDQQEYLRATRYDFSVFAQALGRLTGLKSLEMNCEYCPPSPQMKLAYAKTLAIVGFMIDGGESDLEESGVRALGSLFLALSALPTKLESLEARRVHWAFFDPPPSGLDLYRPVFSHLRHLDLFLEADYDDIEDEEVVLKRQEEFGLALRSARGLESIKLAFGDGDVIPQMVLMERHMNVPVHFSKLFGDRTFPNLKTIYICMATTSEDEFTSFISRHAKTLKHVKLHTMWMAGVPAGWDNVFKTMQRELKLESAEFRGVWGSDEVGMRPRLIKMEGDFGKKMVRQILKGKGGNEKKARKGKAGRKAKEVKEVWAENFFDEIESYYDQA